MKPTLLSILLKDIPHDGIPEMDINSVVTDSRLVTEGALFVAVRGDNFDGHDFAADAVKRGAAACILEHNVDNLPGLKIITKSTKDAHIIIGRNYLQQFSPVIIGVTGSVGKTTTKEMIALILESVDVTVKNEGNLNNEIGLPQTLFRIDSNTKYAVLEMGMNNRGDIRKLTMAARPSAAVITKIGTAHIEYLKTRENILKAKLEITEGMPSSGILAINGDDDLLTDARHGIPVKTISFAIDNESADIRAVDILMGSSSCSFTIEDSRFGRFRAIVPAAGTHNIMDALAAYTVTTGIGIAPVAAIRALADYQAVGMRQNIVEHRGITIVEDCYNANPESMKAALSTVSAIPVKGKRIAVLGDMLELGNYAEEAHRELIKYVNSCGIELLLSTGEHMKEAVEAAGTADPAYLRWFPDQEKLYECLISLVGQGDIVLFKASRGMKFENILEKFYNCYTQDI